MTDSQPATQPRCRSKHRAYYVALVKSNRLSYCVGPTRFVYIRRPTSLLQSGVIICALFKWSANVVALFIRLCVIMYVTLLMCLSERKVKSDCIFDYQIRVHMTTVNMRHCGLGLILGQKVKGQGYTARRCSSACLLL